MDKIEVEFEFEKSTKRTYRYKEVSDDPVVGTLYVKKHKLEGKPKTLQVTIHS